MYFKLISRASLRKFSARFARRRPSSVSLQNVEQFVEQFYTKCFLALHNL